MLPIKSGITYTFGGGALGSKIKYKQLRRVLASMDILKTDVQVFVLEILDNIMGVRPTSIVYWWKFSNCFGQSFSNARFYVIIAWSRTCFLIS